MLAPILFGFRHAIEVILVIAILVAYLVQINRPNRIQSVWIGALLGALGSAGLMGAVRSGKADIPDNVVDFLTGFLSLATVLAMSWILMWLRKSARVGVSIRTQRVDSGASLGTGTLALVTFFSVARVGIPLADYLWAGARGEDGISLSDIWAAVGGIAIAATFGWLVFEWIAQRELRSFFRNSQLITGWLAAGVFASGITYLQRVDALPGKDHTAFDISAQVSVDSVVGSLLWGLFGLLPVMSVLAIAAAAVYAVITTVVALQRGPHARRGRVPRHERPETTVAIRVSDVQSITRNTTAATSRSAQRERSRSSHSTNADSGMGRLR